MNSESGSRCYNMAPPPSLFRQSGQACRSALASKSSHLEPMHSDTPLAREKKTTGAYMPIFAHVRSYAMQKIAQHSWLQYNRLGRIWHGHSKPNVTKTYSTYIPYIPLSTWSESKPRCHRSSRHSSNTRAAVLCTPCRVFFSCSFLNRQRKLLWTVGPH